MGIDDTIFAELEKTDVKKATPKIRSLEDKPTRNTLPISEANIRRNLPVKFSNYMLSSLLQSCKSHNIQYKFLELKPFSKKKLHNFGLTYA